MIVDPNILTGTHFNMVNPLLKEIGEDVMGFLNEIQLKYPEAISFASGRPNELYFGVGDFPAHFSRYVAAMAEAEKKDETAIMNGLGQYNRTKGIINKEVAQYLAKDEAIIADPEDLLITVGSQEAMAIAVLTLCDKERDVIIVEDPTYVGITHFALIAGYEVAPVPVDLDGISLDLLEAKILHYQQQDKKVKIVYVISDYQNPTGNTMSMEKRYDLLQLAEQYDFFILEDNAYGEFSYDNTPLKPVKALDVNNRVIYLRSFAKTLYPSLRLAAMVAGQKVQQDGATVRLSDVMAKTKGYITVNTSAINQAVFGGMLYENNFSLKKVNREKTADLKQKRDQLIASLNEYLDPVLYPWAKDISWNIPQGGFFITIKIPFKVAKTDVIICAEQYRLIFTPMSFFYFGEGGDHEIRLAFSNVSTEQIRTGIHRLVQYFENKINSHHPKNYKDGKLQ